MTSSDRFSPVRSVLLASAMLVLFGVSAAPPANAALIAVTTTADEFGTGSACSLREAIQSANTDGAFGGCAAGTGSDTVSVPAGIHVLSIVGAGENDNLTGDLDLTTSVAIIGAGSGQTTINGNAAVTGDRVFHADPNPPGGAPEILISDVTITGGGGSNSGGGSLPTTWPG